MPRKKIERYAWITRDRDRRLVLVTGPGTALVLAHADWHDRGAQWSPSARGWVVADEHLDDLVADLELHHFGYRIRDREAP